MKRKLFSLFLTALLCMSLIAVPASAQSNENEEPLPETATISTLSSTGMIMGIRPSIF